MVATDVRLMSGRSTGELELSPDIEVEPTGGPLGVIVAGVQLADELSADVIGSLVRLWAHSGVMILRDQDRLTPERQVEVVEWFGRRFYRGASPDSIDQLPMVGKLPVQLLSNRDPRLPGAQLLTGKAQASAVQELIFHSDVQDYAIPPDLTMLHGVAVPPPECGGNTFFWDLFAAYDGLDDDTKARVAHLRWRPRSTYATMKSVKQRQALENPHADQGSAVSHPVVRTHPASGRKALWVSSFTEALLGIEDADEEQALRTRLLEQVQRPEYCYTHRWRSHDALFWDNRCVNHARETWDPTQLREMHRAQAGGSLPY